MCQYPYGKNTGVSRGTKRGESNVTSWVLIPCDPRVATPPRVVIVVPTPPRVANMVQTPGETLVGKPVDVSISMG